MPKIVKEQSPFPVPDPDKVVKIRIFDRRGYKTSCCTCFTLRIGVILICLISFLWVTAELVSSKKFISRIFPKGTPRGVIYTFVYIFFMIIIIGLGISSGFLMVGILADKYMAITCYIWYCIVFEVVYIIIYIATVIGSYINGNLGMKIGLRAIGAVVWHCFFWYFLLTVNRYRIQVFISYQ